MTKTTTPLLIFLLVISFHGNSAQNSDSNQEQTILLQLKQHWSNPTSLSHWTPSSDLCIWPEITCTDGFVTKLEVINRTIAGTLPALICDLRNLTHIDLQFNSLAGSFPTVLYNCSKLQHLDISNNSFDGALPEDIHRLNSIGLRFLSLGKNKFSGEIPSTVGSFQSLEVLFLYGNLFNGSIPEQIGYLSNLEKLDLNYNLGFMPQAIPASFSRLNKLKNLWMTRANLVGEIPPSVGNMSALEFVDLSVNGLNGSIPDDLFLIRNLSILFLYNNQLSGAIPRSIQALKMDVLDLSGNRLTGSIPEDIGQLTELTGLALQFNNLSGELPTSIGKLPKLVNFNVFSNNISGELPPDLGRFSKLERFQVSENQFVGGLPEYLCANKVLLGVIAFSNKLTGELPNSLGDCSSLKYFWVHKNRFSGRIPGGLWSSTKELRLSSNSFTGELPSALGRELSLLEMEDNQFSGPIPATLSFWENLVRFKASNNLFSGVFPQELADIQLLSTLSLDGNSLSGQLPSNLASWKALTFLNLSGNHLSGEIPPSFASLNHLSTLDLSRNDFSGQIPPEIGRLKLTTLNLSSNKLHGKIPNQFENSAFDSSFLNNSGLCSNSPFLGLDGCNNNETKTSQKFSSKFIAATSSLVTVALLLAVFYTIFLVRKHRKKKLVFESNWKLTSFQKVHFTEANILPGLTDENIIGRGGSGKIYRIPINRSGEVVAVKKIWEKVKLDKNLEKEFQAEVEILGTIRHTNIVKLLCSISNEETKFLVYEYMENGSLDRWLHDKRRLRSGLSSSVHHVVLDWPTRAKIAVGAARGLVYMHHECSPLLIHRDVKSSNVLLDCGFNAKIADFGLARMLEKNGKANTMSVVAGSFGYIAPEYSQTKKVNEKADVFSFGVVLLELVTGREAHQGDESLSLVEWSWRHIHENKPLMDALDEDIKETEYMDEIESVLKLGIICTSNFPSKRPSMKDVLQILLRCSQRTSLGSKKLNGNEVQVVPLLRNSKRERALECDDSMFTPLV